jgi:hypothetical protein
MIMSELSIAELQAESVELLPERETLSTVVIDASSTAVARGLGNDALSVSHNHITVIGSGNGSTAVGSFDGNRLF